MSEHLNLPFYEETFDRQKCRGGGGFTPREDAKEFTEVQVYKLGQIQDDFKQIKEKVKTYFDPNLIFKIELKQKVNEEEFIRFLGRSGISVISPSPVGIGYWVIIAEDEDLNELYKRISEYGEKERYKEFHAIESFDAIPVDEKIGDQLKETPLVEGQETYLDIEFWRMEDKRIEEFFDGLQELIRSKDGQITDKLVTENLFIIRAKLTNQILDEIIEFREIARVDRPPKPYMSFSLLSVPYEELNIESPPSTEATAIAVLDSGILSNHPLLEKAVGDEQAFTMLHKDGITPGKPSDDVGHGTKVAGIALYGDIKQCIEDRSFVPELWILSAKVMYAEENPITGEIVAKYDESELLEHQLEKAITWAVSTHPNCKIVNISFSSTYNRMYGNKRQFSLATLIDDLTHRLGIIFVVSTGNITPDVLSANFPNNYPDYLLEDTADVRIMDPASSVYAITVGSITQSYGPAGDTGQLPLSPALTHFPSPFTCVGPGYKSMVKPELVEEGGNIIYSPTDPARLDDIGGKLAVLNPNWISDGRLFTLEIGTSLSAPKVAHYIGKLFNAFPYYSANMIKALLISTSEIPSERPGTLNSINFNSSDTELLRLLSVYGYGKPNINTALSSELNNVLFLSSNSIKLDGVQLYHFNLPIEFINTSGDKQLSITLTYNPPIRRSRMDYMGINMEFHLFRNSTVEEIRTGYRSIHIDSELEEVIPTELKIREIKLHPGTRTRKRGIHQRGIKVYPSKPHIDTEKPLVLAIVSQNRWISDPDYLQDYAVIVTIKHRANIDIYNLIKQQIEVEQRIRLRPR